MSATVRAVLGRIAAICLGLAACYSPPEPDCGFLCGEGGTCPSGYFCAVDGVCHRDGTPESLRCAFDARPDPPRPIDAPPPDADITAPTVFATMPGDGDTNVPTSATIRVQFDEAVIGVTTSTFAVTSANGGIAGGVTQVDPLNYTFIPVSALPASTAITVNLMSQIEDTSGNALAPTMFSFTTAP